MISPRLQSPFLISLKNSKSEDQSPWRNQRRNTRSLRKKGQVSSQEQVNWTSEHQAAISQLISAISYLSVMVYPQYTQPFILHMDASEQGLGAALYRKQDGQLRVLAYEQFRDYLYYTPQFTDYTDNNPFTYG